MSNPSSSKARSLSASVVDYPARDMTVTVGAAMPFGELLRTLREEHQQLPIDVADDTVTVGHMVADDISGPRQFGYGTLRDYVIGIEAIGGDGRVFHAGGRVVKNVAGYDLCRLLVGSKGQLGTITQLTFKLKPIPIQSSLVVAGFRSLRDLESALERLNLTATTPVILDVVSRFAGDRLLMSSVPELATIPNWSDAAAMLITGFEGPAAACHWQSNTLRDELLGTAAWTQEAGNPEASAGYCRTIQQASQPSTDDSWQARLTTLPSRVVAAITSLQAAGCETFGRAGNGVLFVRPSKNPHNETPAADESTGFSLLQSLVEDGAGAVDVIKSLSARPTMSSPAVQELSQKLRAVLGGG